MRMRSEGNLKIWGTIAGGLSLIAFGFAFYRSRRASKSEAGKLIPIRRQPGEKPVDRVDEASKESFPASDPPAY